MRPKPAARARPPAVDGRAAFAALVPKIEAAATALNASPASSSSVASVAIAVTLAEVLTVVGHDQTLVRRLAARFGYPGDPDGFVGAVGYVRRVVERVPPAGGRRGRPS